MSNSSAGGGDTSSPPTLSDRVAIAALVISTVALLGVLFQYIQIIQGLPTVDASVVGPWAKYAHWKIDFFRVDVVYEAPVIFLAPEDNARWPESEPLKWVLNGDNWKETRIEEPPLDQDDLPARREAQGQNGQSRGSLHLWAAAKRDQGEDWREPVHTTRNELASWIRVITAVQKMERDSRIWEKVNWQQPASLVVKMQPMKRSFGKHPAMRRPYATTTIGHLVELCAVLGLYWRDFNQDADKYRAEGNGYTLMGSRVSNFGLVFTFEKPGWPRFKRKRVVPTSEVKELCFGNVPTFWRDKRRDRHLDSHWSITEQVVDTIETLQLGSRKEIGETLNLIRCNEYTIQCYADEKNEKRHIHLFPVIFEVIGMLARTLHIKGRPFTYLPNPVIFPLNKQAFSLLRLLSEFSRHLKEEIRTARYRADRDLLLIDTRATELVEVIEAAWGTQSRECPLEQHQQTVDRLHKALDDVDRIWEYTSREVLLDVLRRHLQEVLQAINTREVSPGSSSTAIEDSELRQPFFPLQRGMSGSTAPASASMTRSSTMQMQQGAFEPIPELGDFGGSVGSLPQQYAQFLQQQQRILSDEHLSFDSLLSVPLENREKELMEKYFNEIRLRVVSTATSHHDPQATQASRAIHGKENEAVASTTGVPAPASSQEEVSATQATQGDNVNNSPSPPVTAPGPSSPPPSQVPASPPLDNPQRMRKRDTWRLAEPSPQDVRRNTVWCALVFRMLCWLILHDFDKKDVQVPKSELMGSRLSVFIV